MGHMLSDMYGIIDLTSGVPVIFFISISSTMLPNAPGSTKLFNFSLLPKVLKIPESRKSHGSTAVSRRKVS